MDGNSSQPSLISDSVLRQKSVAAVLFAMLIGFAVLALVPLHSFKYQWLTSLLFDAAHVPSFFCLSVFIQTLLRQQLHLSLKTRVISASLASVAVAILLEVIQPLYGRTGDIKDVCIGTIGIAVATLSLRPSSERKYYAIGFALVFAVWLFYNTLQLYMRQHFFDSFNDFSSRFSVTLWRNSNGIRSPKLSQVYLPDRQSYVLKGQRIDYDWSGVSIASPLGWNLQNYSALELTLFNPDSAFDLYLRLDDLQGNKAYASEQSLKHGWNQVSFSLHSENMRLLNIQETRKIALFYSSASGPSYYYVDSISFRDNAGK